MSVDAYWIALSLLIIAVLAVGWGLYARAVRVDRLHRQVISSRRTLESALRLRAREAADLSLERVLDPASSILLESAARMSLHAQGPLVDDGLDTPEWNDADPLAGATTAATRVGIENDLTNVLRTVLSDDNRAVLAEDLRGVLALERVDRAARRASAAQRFHNTRVQEAQNLRDNAMVRLFRLAGHAPWPQESRLDVDIA